jgi:hypothetical protein
MTLIGGAVSLNSTLVIMDYSILHPHARSAHHSFGAIVYEIALIAVGHGDIFAVQPI